MIFWFSEVQFFAGMNSCTVCSMPLHIVARSNQRYNGKIQYVHSDSYLQTEKRLFISGHPAQWNVHNTSNPRIPCSFFVRREEAPCLFRNLWSKTPSRTFAQHAHYSTNPTTPGPTKCVFHRFDITYSLVDTYSPRQSWVSGLGGMGMPCLLLWRRSNLLLVLLFPPETRICEFSKVRRNRFINSVFLGHGFAHARHAVEL